MRVERICNLAWVMPGKAKIGASGRGHSSVKTAGAPLVRRSRLFCASDEYVWNEGVAPRMEVPDKEGAGEDGTAC